MIGHFSQKCSAEEGSRDCALLTLFIFFTKLLLSNIGNMEQVGIHLSTIDKAQLK